MRNKLLKKKKKDYGIKMKVVIMRGVLLHCEYAFATVLFGTGSTLQIYNKKYIQNIYLKGENYVINCWKSNSI